VKIKVLPGTVGPPEDTDVELTGSVTDVRCRAGTTTCGSANAQDGADYTGQLQATATIRITDHDNGSPGPGGTDPATVVDLPFPVPVTCAATAGTNIGGTCSTNTTANAVVPGSVKDTKRGVVEIGQLVVNDGGPDGNTATAPNTPCSSVRESSFPRRGWQRPGVGRPLPVFAAISDHCRPDCRVPKRRCCSSP
jgi:hypothetical protein